MIRNFLANSFASYAGIVFLLIFLSANTTIDKHIRKLFYLLSILEFAELTFYHLELWSSTFAQPGIARMLFSAFGYSVRIISIYCFLLLSMRNRTTFKSGIFWAIPAVVNTVLAFSVFFSDIVFSYSPDNHFLRGPLGYVPHIVFLFYLVSILIIMIRDLRGRPLLESVTIMTIVLFITSSVMIETFCDVEGLGCTATVMSTLFYYMFFQTQIYMETMVEEQKNRALFEKKAKTDSMTGLLNKNAFEDEANAILQGNTDDGIALVFLDLDHFKNINDRLGHLTGDSVIQDTATNLQKVFRKADIIGRFGGDEFCVFMYSVTKDILYRRLEEILSVMQTEYENETDKIKVTVSIGAVYCTDHKCSDLQYLLALADGAAYQAKNAGRNHYVVHEME